MAQGKNPCVSIEVMVMGPIENNVYIVSDGEATFVVDPTEYASFIVDALDGRKLDAIVLTHAHWDHVGGACDLRRLTGAQTIASAIDAPYITGEKTLDSSHRQFTPCPVDKMVVDGEELVIGNMKWKVLETPGHTRGSICVSEEEAKAHPEWMSDAGSLSWDLAIDKKIAFHVGYGASKFFRDLNAFEMFWHAEGMKTAYLGEIVLNGVKYRVRPETCYGYSDKNWGGDFTSPWVWLSSNNLVSLKTGRRLENSVFDIGGGRPKVFGLALNRKLLGAFWYEGKNYEFNFSKFWTLSGTKFDCQETEDEILWHVVQTTATAKLDTQIRCQKKDMLHINYEAPTGLKRHNRLWNGGNGTGVLKLYKRRFGREILIDEIKAENIGCEFGEYDR